MVRRRQRISLSAPCKVNIISGHILKEKNLYRFFSSVDSSIPDNKEFHGPSVGKDSPFLYCILTNKDEKQLSCPPAIKLVQTTKAGKTQKYLLRGDSEGFINMWAVPDFSLDEIKQLQNSNSTGKCE
jgi:hypothetical protein